MKLGLENSTSMAFHAKTNEFVEKWTKIGIFVMEYVLCPCVLFPKIIFSFYMYFTTDLSNDAFDLPFPVW